MASRPNLNDFFLSHMTSYVMALMLLTLENEKDSSLTLLFPVLIIKLWTPNKTRAKQKLER